MNRLIWIAILPLLWVSMLKTDASPVLGESSEILQETPAQEFAAQESAAQESAAQESAAQELTASAKEKKAPGLSKGNHKLDVQAYHYSGSKKIHFDDPYKLIQEGKIGASYSGRSYHDLARAFKKDFSDADFGWAGLECPQILWCRFDEPKVPAGVTFLPVQAKAQANDWHVTKWQFVSSKDSKCNQNSAWEVICEDLSGTGFVRKTASKGCFAGKEVQEKYKCFGIRVLEGMSHVGKYNSGDEFQITNINMYEKIDGFN